MFSNGGNRDMRDIKDHPLQNGQWFSSYNLRAKIFEQLVHKDVQGFAQGTWDGGGDGHLGVFHRKEMALDEPSQLGLISTDGLGSLTPGVNLDSGLAGLPCSQPCEVAG